MQQSLAFILSFVSLAFGIGSGVFFFYLWKDSEYKNSFLLKSSVGIFLMYLFQVPFILANGGVPFVQTRFNTFFVLAFLANFLGLIILFWGAALVLGRASLKRVLIVLAAWCLFFILSIKNNFFSYGLVLERIPLLIGVFLFFIPLRLGIIASLTHAWSKEFWHKRRAEFYGAILFQISVLVNLGNYFAAIRKMLYYPKDFWFIAIVDDKTMLFLGMLSSVLLVVALFKIFQSQKPNIVLLKS